MSSEIPLFSGLGTNDFVEFVTEYFCLSFALRNLKSNFTINLDKVLSSFKILLDILTLEYLLESQLNSEILMYYNYTYP